MKEINTLKPKARIPYVAVEMRIKEVVPGKVLCQSGGLTIESFTLEDEVEIPQSSTI